MITPAALERLAPLPASAEGASAEGHEGAERAAHLGPTRTSRRPTSAGRGARGGARLRDAVGVHVVEADAGINHKRSASPRKASPCSCTRRCFDGHRADEQPWSVKLTGGPDGDVGGNMLKILPAVWRWCASSASPTARVRRGPTGAADGGAARLFDEGLRSARCREALGPQGVFLGRHGGGRQAHLAAGRVQADVFVPAGGRPSTVNGANWRDFLLPDGTPSARSSSRAPTSS